jgi:hypothetical protein
MSQPPSKPSNADTIERWATPQQIDTIISGTKAEGEHTWYVLKAAWAICKHCKQPRRDHADNEKCLYEPTSFEPEIT